MRIAIVTEVFLPKIDGVVTRLTNTLDQLAKLGHEVRIFATGTPPETYAGFSVTRIPSHALWVYPEVQFGLPTFRFFRAIRDFDPDVIHAVNPIWTAALGVFAAERDAVPLVASFHTNVPEYTEALGIGWLRPVAQKAITFLHNRAAINLCTSGPMVYKARDMGIHTVRLWPKAVDTQAYRPDNYDAQMRFRLTGGHPEAPLITYIGRISQEKDLARLNEVMHQVRTRMPAARLALVGAGPALEDLRAQFDSATTVFTGYLSGAELQAAFAVGDVFAFPSATETLGLVALESFASGVPVVGTNAGGIPFVIEHEKTGLLVDEGATNEHWARALCSLLENPQARQRMRRATLGRNQPRLW